VIWMLSKSTDLNKNRAGAKKAFSKLNSPEGHKPADLVRNLLTEAAKMQVDISASSSPEYYFARALNTLI